jgi:hypothetical protein
VDGDLMMLPDVVLRHQSVEYRVGALRTLREGEQLLPLHDEVDERHDSPGDDPWQAKECVGLSGTDANEQAGSVRPGVLKHE